MISAVISIVSMPIGLIINDWYEKYKLKGLIYNTIIIVLVICVVVWLYGNLISMPKCINDGMNFSALQCVKPNLSQYMLVMILVCGLSIIAHFVIISLAMINKKAFKLLTSHIYLLHVFLNALFLNTLFLLLEMWLLNILLQPILGINIARKDDIVFILGKGNETYQKLKNEEVIYFNDIEEATKALEELLNEK